jgi:hypothetical protein
MTAGWKIHLSTGGRARVPLERRLTRNTLTARRSPRVLERCSTLTPSDDNSLVKSLPRSLVISNSSNTLVRSTLRWNELRRITRLALAGRGR